MAPPITLASLPTLLESDNKVKVAGVDIDGVLRGKIISKAKFLSVAEAGFGFCSVIFGWDMHDALYAPELGVSNRQNGYRDVLAVPDLASFRRIPWEHNIPFFLVSFLDSDTREPLVSCPRGLLARQVARLETDLGGAASVMAGAEYEFWNFRAPDGNPSPAAFLEANPPEQLSHLTLGMYGYSLTRPIFNRDYYYAVFDTCAQFGVPIEGWHTESGPGVLEAALEYGEARQMADRASLFKLAVRGCAAAHGITPCFMAKPRKGLPGNSGHMHVSLVDADGSVKKNLLARDSDDPAAPWPDVARLSDLGRHFLAGILDGLADMMVMVAPTVNSYKRLVENFWAPVTVSWGLENRSASVRLIAPPICPPAATRFEVRVAGADANPHLVLAAILALGWRGVHKKLKIPFGPEGSPGGGGARLPRTLREAVTRFMGPDSVAREVLGDGFVDHYGGTREHEARLFEEAVTDWEVRRYIETV